MRKLVFFAAMMLGVTSLCAKDIYVSLETGKNKNEGTKEAPLKNLWKALYFCSISRSVSLFHPCVFEELKQGQDDFDIHKVFSYVDHRIQFY